MTVLRVFKDFIRRMFKENIQKKVVVEVAISFARFYNLRKLCNKKP